MGLIIPWYNLYESTFTTRGHIFCTHVMPFTIFTDNFFSWIDFSCYLWFTFQLITSIFFDMFQFGFATQAMQ